MSTALLIGILLATVHAGLVAFLVYGVLNGAEPAWPMYWLVLFYLDLPFSLLWLLVAKLRGVSPPITLRWLPQPTGDLDNFVLPVLVLGVGGTMWWYVLPQIVARAFD